MTSRGSHMVLRTIPATSPPGQEHLQVQFYSVNCQLNNVSWPKLNLHMDEGGVQKQRQHIINNKVHITIYVGCHWSPSCLWSLVRPFLRTGFLVSFYEDNMWPFFLRPLNDLWWRHAYNEWIQTWQLFYLKYAGDPITEIDENIYARKMRKCKYEIKVKEQSTCIICIQNVMYYIYDIGYALTFTNCVELGETEQR